MKLTPLRFIRRRFDNLGRPWHSSERSFGKPAYGRSIYTTNNELFLLRRDQKGQWYATASTQLFNNKPLALEFTASGLQGQTRFRRRSDLVQALEAFMDAREET